MKAAEGCREGGVRWKEFIERDEVKETYDGILRGRRGRRESVLGDTEREKRGGKIRKANL